PRERCLHRPHTGDPAQPVALPEDDLLRVRGARQAHSFLDHSGDERHVRGQQGGIGEPVRGHRAVHHVRQVGADGLLDLVAQFFHAYGRVLGDVVTETDPAETDALDAFSFEIVEPGVVAARVLGGAVLTGVTQPQFHVLGRVLDITLDDPPGATGPGDPTTDPILPVVAVGVHPVGQDLAPAALGQLGGGLANQFGADGVAGQVGFAVGVAGSVGGDHERWVGHDQVEAFVLDRFVQETLFQAGVGDPGQRQADPGQTHSTRIEVGGDHVTGPCGQVQGLYPTAGPHVEGAFDRTVHDELGQRRRGVSGADDMIVSRDDATAGSDLRVGDDEAGTAVLQLPRSEVYQRTNTTALFGLLDGDQVGLDEFVHGQDRTDGPLGHGGVEPPQA